MKLISMTPKEYRRIHDWIRKRKNHIKECAFCGKTDTPLDNALINGKEHEKCENNYIKLCRKCHYNYDHPSGYKHTDDTKLKIGIKSKIRIKENGVNENFISSRKGKKITNEHKSIISLSMSGENHHQSKLTEDEVMYIFHSEESFKTLIDKYKITYRTIRNIKTKSTWKHLNL